MFDAFAPKLVKVVFSRYIPPPSKVSLDKRETVSLGTSGNEKWKACSNTVIWGAMGKLNTFEIKAPTRPACQSTLLLAPFVDGRN
jgi:hypothetical protein